MWPMLNNKSNVLRLVFEGSSFNSDDGDGSAVSHESREEDTATRGTIRYIVSEAEASSSIESDDDDVEQDNKEGGQLMDIEKPRSPSWEASPSPYRPCAAAPFFSSTSSSLSLGARASAASVGSTTAGQSVPSLISSRISLDSLTIGLLPRARIGG